MLAMMKIKLLFQSLNHLIVVDSLMRSLGIKNFLDYRYNTGSYNWTYSAEFKNAENLIFIESHVVTKKYTDYFEKRWKISAPSLKDISNNQGNVKNIPKKKSR